MIRRFAVASLLTVASAAGLSSASFAQSVPGTGTVNFNAVNPATCVVTPATTNGTFTPSATNANGFTTQLSGSGTVNAQCNQTGTSTFVTNQTGGAITLPTTSAITAGASVPGNGTSTPVTVSLVANTPPTYSVIPADTYAFNIVVTVTP